MRTRLMRQGNRLTMVLCLSIFLLAPLYGQIKNEPSLLWKIEGNGIKTSYIYGTFHLLPQADFKLKEVVTKAFESTEQLVLELDMDDPSMQLEIMKHSSMKDGQTLDELFSKEEYQQVDSAMKATMGMGLALMNKLKPFVISSMFMGSFIEGQPASFEMTFIQMAQENEMEVLGLETVAQQMAVFDSIPYQKQADDIIEMLNDQASARKEFTSLLDIYYTEDIDHMLEVTKDYMENESELDNMVTNRNINWIPLIGKFIKEKSTFIGVGAGHLGGEHGVINLLREAGYTLTAIR